MIFYDNYNLCKEALFICTHIKKLQRLFQEIYEYKIFLSNIVKENTGKAKVLERTGFTGILKTFIFIKHLWVAA